MTPVPFDRGRDRMVADPAFRKEYATLDEECAPIEARVEARMQANMAQADVAKAMEVSASLVHFGQSICVILVTKILGQTYRDKRAPGNL